MADLTLFDSFYEALAEKKHNLGSDTLKILLTNTAPEAADAVKGDLTEITAEHGYSAGGATVTITASSQTSGTYKLIGTDVVITADGGSIGPFQYIALYNDTAGSDELIGWWDYGSAITLADGEAFTLDLNGTDGILQLALVA